jgi:hypothetical protein
MSPTQFQPHVAQKPNSPVPIFNFEDLAVPIKLVSDPLAYVGMITFALLNVISWVSVTLRFVSRYRYARLGWDDWTLLVAQV